MNAPHILSCGEVLWDLFPEGAKFGGAPANFACHAALQGARVSLLSAVGHDARGREATAILESLGVDTSWIQVLPDAATGTVGVVTDAAGKPRYEIHAGSAWDQLAWTTELEALVHSADAVYFGTLGQRSTLSRATVRQVLGLATLRGIPRILDVNLRPPFYDDALIRESLEAASVVKLSDEELPGVAAACGLDRGMDPETQLRALLRQFNLTHLAMTRGAEGALLLSPHQTIDQRGIPVVVRDTVGAGDSFTAALVTGLLRGDSLATIARNACETASTVCAHDGAVPHVRPDISPAFSQPDPSSHETVPCPDCC